MLAGAESRFRCDSAHGPSMVRGRFEQFGAKLRVNFDGTADHAIRKLVDFHLRALRVLRGCSLSVTLSTRVAPQLYAQPRGLSPSFHHEGHEGHEEIGERNV